MDRPPPAPAPPAPAPPPADRLPAAPTTGDRGLGDRGLGNRGTENRGIGDRGIGSRGIGNRGTENRGTGPQRSALSAPPRVDFPDTIVGEVPTLPIYVTNLDRRYQAQVHIHLDDETVFRVRSKPAWLRASVEPSAPIVIEFRPRTRAVWRARLRVTAVWQGNAHPAEELVIELQGLAHRDGEPTHAEAAEQARRETEARTAAQQQARTNAELERAYAAYSKSATQAPPHGLEVQLRRAYDDALSLLENISNEQRIGVNTARGEAKSFRRKPRAPERSLAWELAIVALDVASAGLANVVSSKLGRALRRPSHGTPRAAKQIAPGLDTKDFPAPAAKAPSRAPRKKSLELHDEPIDYLTESVKTLLRDSAAGHLEAAIRNGKDFGADNVEAAVYFFAMQDSLLNQQIAARKQALIRLHYGLIPRLHGKDAETVIDTFQATVAGLAEAHTEAQKEQLKQSRKVWMRFLSQGALGSMPAPSSEDGGRVSDTRGANHTAPSGGQVTPIDGVIEAEIEADFAKPATPVKLLGLRCTGVTSALFKGLLAANEYRLRGIGVVVRVAGKAKGVAEFRISAVQDESGELRFTDNTAPAGIPSTWLTRKAGGWGTTRQHAGARVLMDEVLDTVLGEAVGDGHVFFVPIWTDQQ